MTQRGLYHFLHPNSQNKHFWSTTHVKNVHDFSSLRRLFRRFRFRFRFLNRLNHFKNIGMNQIKQRQSFIFNDGFRVVVFLSFHSQRSNFLLLIYLLIHFLSFYHEYKNEADTAFLRFFLLFFFFHPLSSFVQAVCS